MVNHSSIHCRLDLKFHAVLLAARQRRARFESNLRFHTSGCVDLWHVHSLSEQITIHNTQSVAIILRFENGEMMSHEEEYGRRIACTWMINHHRHRRNCMTGKKTENEEKEHTRVNKQSDMYRYIVENCIANALQNANRANSNTIE